MCQIITKKSNSAQFHMQYELLLVFKPSFFHRALPHKQSTTQQIIVAIVEVTKLQSSVVGKVCMQ